MRKVLKTLELEYTTLEFYENFVVSQVREDVIFSKSQVYDLAIICSAHYAGKKYVYISNRVNNYNVDPIVYVQLEKMKKNLYGIGVVINKPSTLNMVQFEQTFIKTNSNIFFKLEEAMEWAEELLKK
ncbi:hypothetical protein L1I30_07200 [Gillisia sp. M10.2A]|uniref:STAS/SEC14 domain-containing protein n=1 Tax=Gillisia lutea TaxID=2909668 RepID=A0ABS9EI40_9FLAO|nr:hypothetical protein [Gillisia lutea]MCF4101445.1 hypothetical protein [Gillisia lutea]